MGLNDDEENASGLFFELKYYSGKYVHPYVHKHINSIQVNKHIHISFV